MSTDYDGIQFGQYLVDQGIVTPAELEAALMLQGERNPRLGRLAEKMGLIDLKQTWRILQYQHENNVPFGRAAIDLGILSEFEVSQLVERQSEGHVHIGELLAELHILTHDELRQHLDAYFQHEQRTRTDQAERGHRRHRDSGFFARLPKGI